MPDLIAIVCVSFDHRADTEGLKRFKECLFSCPNVETSMEVSGTYDLILRVKLESLSDYKKRIDGMAEQLAEFVTQMDTNFVCRAIEKANNFVWVPCPDGHRRIDLRLINKITAEGDYMRLHTPDGSHLFHDTMQHLADTLNGDFVQLHRSCIVRCDFIERIIHRSNRWVVRLHDGDEQKVAKSRVADLLDQVRSSTKMIDPAKTSPPADKPVEHNEIELIEMEQ